MLKLSASVPNINKWRIAYLAVELFVPWNVQQNNLSRKARWMETIQQISTNNEANKKRQDAPQRIDHTPQKKKKKHNEIKEPRIRLPFQMTSKLPRSLTFFFFVSERKKRSLYVNRNQRSLVTTDSSASRHQSFWFFQKFFDWENVNWWNWRIGRLFITTWRRYESIFKDFGLKLWSWWNF